MAIVPLGVWEGSALQANVYHLSFVASKPARLDLDARSSSPYPGSHKIEGCVERFGQGTDRAGDESSLSLGNSVEQL